MASSTVNGRTAPDRMTPGARRALVASTVGTLIEWYDYALYGAAAGLVITPLFFPSSIQGAGDMLAFATFAVGFLVRPLGGLIIAHFGDRFGRKPALLLTIILMGLATVGIGLLPTAAVVGIWAPILLVLLRVLQGFGAGAELAGALTVVAEFAPERRRGYYTAIVMGAPPAGATIATLAFLGATMLPDDGLMTWGWRIPFLVSALLFFVALYIRNRMGETPEFVHAMEKQQERRRDAVPARELLASSWRSVVVAFFSITGHNAHYYILGAFSLSFLTKVGGMTKTEALTIVTMGSVIGVFASPLGGKLADRFGAGRVMRFGVVVGALYTVPLFLAMKSGDILFTLAMFVIGYGVVLTTTSAPQGAFLTNLFPARYRFSGVAMAREINGAVVAGTAPMVATALVAADHGGIRYAAAFLVACFLLSLVTLLIARGYGDRPVSEVRTPCPSPMPSPTPPGPSTRPRRRCPPAAAGRFRAGRN